MPRANTEADLWVRIGEPNEQGCAEWQGYRDPDGYGMFRWAKRYGRRVMRAHRVVYELRHGPIPAGMEVLHRCDNPPCTTDAHHRLGTQADNQRDMSSKGRNHHSVKTHCRNGHPFDGRNTIRRSDNGGRKCRACHNAAVARSGSRKREG